MNKNPGKQKFVILDVVAIATAVAVISYFHYSTVHLDFMSHTSFHILLRRLYYIPIIYAAIRFGLKGGLLTSLSITAIFTPHAAASMGGLFESGSIDNFFDIILYNIVAVTTGLVVDSRRRQKQRYEEMLQLNREIEDRETALRQIKSYTESILNSVSSGVISVDHRGRVVTSNPAACSILGQHEEDLVSFPLETVFAGHEELLRASALVLAGEQPRATLEMELPAREDGNSQIAVRITPHLSSGRTVGVVISMEDMTEVRNLTRQLLRADKLSGLGELVAGVAHEVRNPLGVIRASVQMMRQEGADGDHEDELTRVMIQEIDRLDAFVNALLDFGRPSESQLGPVNACRTLDEVVLLTKQFALQQNVEVFKDAPSSACDIWADENRIKQIFINLISNAIQSMPDGGELGITMAADDGYLRILFADTGTGIPDDEQARIFDPFYTARPDGSGLGLSIVHRIVDTHKGYISVESEPGKGSTFTVGLPLVPSRAAAKESTDA